MWEIKSCKKTDDCYPESLKKLDAAPGILYYVGDIGICESDIVAVIGKREAEERFLKIARAYGEALARRGYTVLNGLALGIDAQALEGAVSVKGKTIAVMPGGLDEVYPKTNTKLAEKIVENGGCLISEYPRGTKPQRFTYVQRNRIQAMLSQKVFVVDAEKDGGTMRMVEYAMRLSKPLGCYMEKEKPSPAGNQFLVDTNKASAIRDTDTFISFIEQPIYTQMTMF